MGPQIIAAIAALPAWQKHALLVLLYKTPANRDVLTMIMTGKKTTEGSGAFVTNGLAATQISNIRNRILIADLPALRDGLFKNPANRAAFNALRQNQQQKTDPGAS